MASLREPDDNVHRLTAEQRRTLLHMLDTFPAKPEPVPGWGCPEVIALTNLWLSLHPPSHGNYAYLRAHGQEHIALAGMRHVILTTPWGRPRD